MHHSRAYSYDDPEGGYSSNQVPPHQGQYPTSAQQYDRGYQQPQGSGQYYVQTGNNAHVTQPDPYLRNMAPVVPPTHQYTSTGHHRDHQSPGGSGSSSQAHASMYPAQTPYYQQYPRSQTTGVHSSEGPFIPTPSDLYNAYPPRQISVPPQSPTPDPYSTPQYPPPHSIVPSSRSPEQRPARISTGRPLTSPGSPISSPSGERFPCERCGKTFSRSHDRKRHHETQHLTSPVIHRCRYCEKEFSRADSLKRHLDNGCDEMPS